MRNKKRIKPFLKLIEKFWLKNPDLRFTQVLVALKLIPNFPGMWFYVEDDEAMDFHPSVMFWGTYGINGDEKLKFVSIDKMGSEHIKACLEIPNIDDGYRRTMEKELEERGDV